MGKYKNADYTRGTLRVKGARDLRRALKDNAEAITELKDTNKKVAVIVSDAGTRNVPVGPGGKPHLRDTLKPFGTKTVARVRAGSKALPYAGVIHWGWPQRHIKAQPFLSDAAQQTQPKWLNIYMGKIQEIIDNIVGATNAANDD